MRKSIILGTSVGAIFGALIGLLIPSSRQMSAKTDGMPVLNALMMGRFETAILTSFLLSVLATIVGAWTGGRNLIPRAIQEKPRSAALLTSLYV